MKKFFKKHKRNIITITLLITLSLCSSLTTLSIYSYVYNKPVGHEISEDEVLNFPEEFLWGSATAAYQVEGGNFHSSWWDFEKIKGNIKNGDSAEFASDHYNRYEEDIALMDELSLNSYRFSIEWSRIEPEKGVFDDDEIEHYRSVLNELDKQGIKPMVTLMHHSVPKWFEDEGGFEEKKSVDYFSEYAEYLAKNLDDEVELWVTINEPMAFITSGYISGKWPPGKEEPLKVPAVFTNLVNSHKGAFTAIHENDKDAKVGIAEHTSYVVPYGEKNILENIAVFTIDKVWNHYMIERVLDELDFIGVHYYYKQTISVGLALEALTKDPEEFEDQSLDRAYYPEGLFEVLMKFKTYNKPIYITELGVQDYHEVSRDKFLKDHIREIYYAIEAGVDIRGLYYWSFIDCFEWSEGYGPKFGLVALDRETLDRSVKEESWVYSDIAKCNCVEN